MTLTIAIVAIFLATTTTFTTLLMQNVSASTLSNLQTANKTLSYAINGKKSESESLAEGLAANSAIQAAVTNRDHGALVQLTDGILAKKKQSLLIITADDGQVLLRGDNPDRWGDSISSDTSVRRALIGQASLSIKAKDDVVAPLIYISSATPVRDLTDRIIGTITTGVIADSGFLDGIKSLTGLDITLYAGDTRSATTLTSSDGKSRLVGIKEENKQVKDQVLGRGQSFSGSVTVAGAHYLASYQPIKDVDNTLVGMQFIGIPEVSILQTTASSIEITFLISVLLLLLSILPAYLIARYISYQLH